MDLDSIMVVYDDSTNSTTLNDFYMRSLNDAIVSNGQPNSSRKYSALHWMRITNDTTNDDYFQLMFDNVEIGLQVRKILYSEMYTYRNH